MDKVIVGMSGGVDSSVAVSILKRNGYKPIGITLKIPGTRCCNIGKAQEIAENLGIEYRIIDVEEYFQKEVVEYTMSQYKTGKTPNPCVVCNRKIKFHWLMKVADEMGAKYIATGHYAKIEYNDKRYILKRGKDQKKSQEYFLAMLTQKQLSRTLFPLGDLTKKEVIEIAEKMDIPVSQESQNICFLLDEDKVKGLIKEKSKGPILDENGNIIGKHCGINKFTIGQRKGIGISAPYPLYVLKILPEKNAVVVGKESALYKKRFKVEHPNWIAFESPEFPIEADVKIRYRFKPAPAIINDNIVEFLEPQRAIAPGQLAVFYNRDTVLGSAWIKEIKFASLHPPPP